MTTYITRNLVVYDASEDRTITVQEDGDGLEMVVVKCNSDFYGNINFSMNYKVAEALAKAIIEQCKYIKEKQ